MAKKKVGTEATVEPGKDAAPESISVKAAKGIGQALGKIAKTVGLAQPAKRKKILKLAAKNKSRLPRRQKKAAKKAAKRTGSTSDVAGSA
jgi:hypothetical protein